ncbi:endogenous retrovirus group K member 6 Env polyprotein-like isoform X2 [Lepus europaeus]|nr:endogenous retrovirus group K member 6 Env polyprotein-like isoform X2 [Lepus europaeus]XP_062048095.1 endogenous retrovirus group K member 6 Env polyprotein-like isoform X2 [Lepus europaeus]XP_062048096.1 endogenous retrovirus group K member 6 Env polyprotein-like isoform X2 [Lepus europaeus]
MAKRVRCDCDPPVEEMRNLTLRMAVGPTLRTRQAHPPTWGQLKKLNQEADKILVRTGKPKTAVTMCLAMLAVLEMSVSVAGNHVYWTFVPNPPLLQFVHWHEPSPLLFVNETSWLPGPWDPKGPEHVSEEGMPFNATIWPQGLPICFGNNSNCLNLNYQAWMAASSNGTQKPIILHVLSAYSFQYSYNHIINYSYPSMPFCQVRKSSIGENWIQWEKCRGREAFVLLNTSYGRVIDISPKGQAWSRNHPLKWQIEDNSNTISTSAKESFKWHGMGMAAPFPFLEGSLGQSQIWKIPVALKPLHGWNAKYTHAGNYTLTLTKNATIFVRTCVRPPYVFFIGNVLGNTSFNLVGRLFMCLNRSTPFNHSQDSIYVLRSRSSIWIPTQLHREWQQTAVLYTVKEVLTKLLHRAKRMIGILITLIIGFIMILTTAAAAGVSLHQSVQTTHFVQDWHKNASHLWSTQSQLDKEILSELADLQQAVRWLGDQLMVVKTRGSLPCDWNYTTICVTPFKYNHSNETWDLIKDHLTGSLNTTALMKQLHDNIEQTFSNPVSMIGGAGVLEGMLAGITDLNPLKFIKPLGGGMLFLAFVLICVCLLLCLVFHQARRRNQWEQRQLNLAALFTIKTALKKKGGTVGV